MSAHGKLIPKQLVDHAYKPGSAWKGNGAGRPKTPRKLDFVDHLREYFDEESTFTLGNGKSEVMPRSKFFATMIGQAAISSGQPQLRRECIGIVIDTLWPKAKEAPAPFIQVNEHHGPTAIGFFTHVDRLADGAPVTPELIVEALRLDSEGKLDSATLADLYGNGNEQEPKA